MKVYLKLSVKAFMKIGNLILKRVLSLGFIFISLCCVIKVSAQKVSDQEASCLNTIESLSDKTEDRSTQEETGLFDASQIKTFQDLAEAISKGLLLTEGQEGLWSIYQNTFLSDPTNTDESVKNVLYVLEDHPELSKPVFREQILSFQNKIYQFPEGLSDFTRKFTTNSSQKKALLLRVKENLSYWSKIFHINRGSKKQLNSKEKKLIREQTLSLLEKKLGGELIAQLEKMEDYNETLILRLYYKLNKERGRQLSEGQLSEAEPISLALLNLIHTAGFSSHAVLKKLRNKEDPQIVIKGLNQILEYREHLSRELGFKSFNDFKDSLELKTVGKEYDTEQLKSKIEKFKEEMEILGYELTPSEEYRVRALSLIESPFRGCVGGTDCSSKFYFAKGLDPNYIYWTKTDKSFYSSGQVTTVLGTARLNSSKNSKKIKVAFIDKIQNISTEELIPLLSAIQKSLKEQGYLLAFSKKVEKDINGLSNSYEILDYVAEKILPKLEGGKLLKNFTPHSHKYIFFDGYTKANNKLDVLTWDESLSESFEDNRNVSISPGQKYSAYTLEDLIPDRFINNLLKLRESEKEEEVRVFLNSIHVLNEFYPKEYSKEKAGEDLKDLLKKHEFSEYRLRRDILYKLGEFDFDAFLESSFSFFSAKERKENLIGDISNWDKTHIKKKRELFIGLNLAYKIKTEEMKEWKNIFGEKSLEISNEDVFLAISLGSLDLIKLLKDKMDLINMRYKDGTSALQIAVLFQNMKLVEYFVLAGADINYVNYVKHQPYTALIYAIAVKDIEIVRYLIKKEVDVSSDLSTCFDTSD